MVNYNFNELMNECLDRYYDTFSHTLDTSDYVPEKYNLEILAFIRKQMKRSLRRLVKDDKRYQRIFRRKKLYKLSDPQKPIVTEESLSSPSTALVPQNAEEKSISSSFKINSNIK